jgi:protein tyrosine/serine phosphatase
MIDDARHLPWDACLNVRDLGGFATRDGRTTRWRSLVRADNLCRLTWHGRTALVRYGVRTVIDLRSKKELALEHDPFDRPELADVTYLNLPQLSAEFWARWNHRMTGHEGDLLTLETCRQNIAEMFTAIASAPEGGVLLHCHAGKERTGLAAAMLLAVTGVDAEVINADHVASDAYLEPLYVAWLAQVDDAATRERGTAHLRLDPEQMLLTLKAVEERYGGAERYVLDCGVRRADLERVRERLLA